MSTIKQLTLEEEILKEYRDLHDQADKLVFFALHTEKQHMFFTYQLEFGKNFQ